MSDRPIGLVIFDCDGVLVDSEPIAMRVLIETIAELGIDIPPADAFREYLGRSLASISDRLAATHGIALGPAALERMRGRLYAAYRESLNPSPWLAEVLARLTVPFCVASSSSVERVRVSLEVTGLLRRFADAVFSSSMVANGKPAPDLFLHVAAEMGVAPAECVVIEDSPAGVQAARAAGMRVFAYLGGGHVQPAGLAAAIAELEPDATFRDMRVLPGLVALHEARARGQRPRLLAAVDVGTASARGAIVDAAGNLLGRAELPIGTRQGEGTWAEQDSTEIWAAAAGAVRGALANAGARPEEVTGLAFDATCSLVVRDRAGAPLAVSASADDRWDTIAWFDHRAIAEAEECTATGHPVLRHLGGVMSPEMELPKLMWLKRRRPEAWARLGHAFDLSDYLTWRATGSTARSWCTLTCKWSWRGDDGSGWPDGFLAAIGLADLRERCALPETAVPVGHDLGPLLPGAAAELGLTTDCRVAAGFVDAHAGTLGALGALAASPADLDRHLVLIAGTSSCVMALSPDPRPVAGVWGPFADAVAPGAFLNEAGQSASGALLDHVIRWHGAGGEPTPERHAAVLARIAELRRASGGPLAPRLHVLPDFHGNRSPQADPRALGVVSGLTLDAGFDSLCRLYFRTALALALQLRHLLETLVPHGYDARELIVAGGHLRNPLLMELYADAANARLVVPNAADPTLLGVAMAAATGAGVYPGLAVAAAAMDQGRAAAPVAGRSSYDADYAVFREMIRQRAALEEMAGREEGPPRSAG